MKQIMKRGLSGLMALVMVFSLLPMNVLAAEEELDHEHCDVCGQHECICPTEDGEGEATAEVCTTCGKDPCECVEAEVCADCGKEVCECAVAEVCETCKNAVCTCESTGGNNDIVTDPVVEEPNAEPAYSDAYLEIQAMIDDMLCWYLLGVDAETEEDVASLSELTREDVEAAVAAMDSDSVWQAQVEISDLEETINAYVGYGELSEAEIEDLAASNEVYIWFAEDVNSTSTGPNMLADTYNAITGVVVTVTHTNTLGVASVTSSCSNGKVSVIATTSTNSWIGNPQATGTISVKNNSGSKKILKFDWNVDQYATINVNGVTSGTSGTVEVILDSGGAVSISFKSPSGSGNKTNLTLDGFSLEDYVAHDIIFNYDTSAISKVTIADTEDTDGSITYTFEAHGATVTATVSDGYVFCGWQDTDGNIYANSKTLKFTAPAILTAVVSPAVSEADAIFKVGSTYFNDLNNAAVMSATAGSPVILLKDYTLPSGNYTIPKGATLLIPYDDSNTLCTTTPTTVNGNNTGWSTPLAYRTLTMASGANITVNGALSLSGKIYAAHSPTLGAGSPTEYAGFIKMESDSSITVNNGANLYAWGYIYGSGTVTANSGATVYECFQINDWRGGNQTIDMKNSVFPMSQYYVQNIEVPLTINAGASEHAYSAIHATGLGVQGTTISFFGTGNSSAMFRLSSGNIIKKYDGSKDRLVIEVNGDMSISPMDLAVPGMFQSINSGDYNLAINSNITVRVNSGKISINQDVALLPGSEMIVAKGATVTLVDGTKVYVYDTSEWGGYVGSNNNKLLPIRYAPGKDYNRTEKDLVDAKIEVAGTVDASVGYVYTTSSGANICGAEGGVAKVGAAGTETVTYQLVYGDPSTYPEILVTAAKLQNGTIDPTTGVDSDTSYVQTNATANTYTFTNDKWICKTHTGGAAATCDTAQTCTVCGAVVAAATGHSWSVVENSAAWNEDNAVCTVDLKCANDGSHTQTAVASVKVDTSASEATCLEGGDTTYTASFAAELKIGTQTKIVTSIALGHTYEEINRNDATCVSSGSIDYRCSRCKNSVYDYSKTIPALGHDWGETSYAGDGITSYTATRVCQRACGSKGTETSTATITSDQTKDPTCNDEGETTYTATFTVDWAEDKTTTVADVDVLGHTWGDVSLEWSEDNKCKATRVCSRNESHIETANATVMSNTVDPTCEAAGYTTYTASFTEQWVRDANFTEAQLTETVPGDAATGHKWTVDAYSTEWNEDYTKCTVDLVCVNGCDSTKEVIESVSVASVGTAATCTEAGGYTYTAEFADEWNIADQTKTVTQDALGHAWGDVGYTWSNDYSSCTASRSCSRGCEESETKQSTASGTATCTTPGKMTYTVTFDNKAFQAVPVVVDQGALGHDLKEVPAVEATCQHGGNNAYYTCQRDDCGGVFKDDGTTSTTVSTETIEIQSHNYTNYKSNNDATCTADGTKSAFCAYDCGTKSTVTDEGSKLAHQYTKYVYNNDASCLKAGTETAECDTCDTNATYTRDSEENPRLDHDYECDITRPATCEVDGLATYTCKNGCNGYYTEAISATGHDWSVSYSFADDGKTCTATRECGNDAKHNVTIDGTIKPNVTTPATCTEMGKTTYTARFDEDWADTQTKIVADVAATDHAWSVEYGWSTDGQSCTATHVCGNDAKHNETEAVTASGAVKTAATCTEKGWTIYTANFEAEWAADGQTKDVQDIPATEHKWGAASYEWSKDGKTCTATRVCANDASHVETSNATVDSKQTKDPTCTEKGETTYTATFTVGWSEEQTTTLEDVNALGHKDADFNHVCENGCGVSQGVHEDEDTDHKCDYGCDEAIGHHNDVTTDTDHLCDYCKEQMGDHEYVNGKCNCGDDQYFAVSMIIRAAGADDVSVPQNDIKYGSEFAASLDFSSFGNCYAMESLSVTVGGNEIASDKYDYSFVNKSLKIAGEAVVGNIEIVVTASQQHTVGETKTVYTPPTCTEDGKIDVIINCGKCSVPVSTTTTSVAKTGHSYAKVYTAPTFQADGYTTYTCTICEDTYVVVEEGSKLTAVATIGEDKYESLEGAIEDARPGDVIILHTQVAVEGDAQWDLNGITLRIADGDNYGLVVKGNLTINSGSYVATGLYGIGVEKTGKLTINGGSFSGSYNDYLIGSWGTTVIEGGTFNGQYNCVNGFDGTVTVKGGSFTTADKDYTGSHDSKDVLGNVVVSGGAFSKTVICNLEKGYCQKLDGVLYRVGKHVGGAINIENIVPASCSAAGSHEKAVYCTHCGEEMSRETITDAALPHTVVEDAYKAPTCEDAGKTAGRHCSECGGVIVAQKEIPAINHAWSVSYEWSEDYSSCTATRTCGNDVSHKGTYKVTVSSVQSKAPTCTEKGKTLYTASFNVEGISDTTSELENIDALNHDWEITYTWSEDNTTCSAEAICKNNTEHKHSATVAVTTSIVQEATCETDGSAEKTATFTNEVFSTQTKTITLSKLGHSYTNYVSNNDLSCTRDGTKTAVCDNGCGTEDTLTITGSATGHSMTVKSALAPTCTAAGNNAYYTCSRCSGVFKDADGNVPTTAEEEILPALGHDYVSVVTAPTCVAQGYTTHTCNNDTKHTYIDSYVNALGHSYDEGKYLAEGDAPSCTDSGVKTYTCSVCDEGSGGHTKTESVPALGHSETRVPAKTANCTEMGYKSCWYCATCGRYYEDSDCTVSIKNLSVWQGVGGNGHVPAKGHKEQAVSEKAPTCTEAGYKAYWYCEVCGEYYADADCKIWIENLGNWQSEGGEGYLAAKGHSTNPESIDAKTATCTEAGYRACWRCADCGIYFEDAAGSIIIESLAEWRGEKENGYVPASGHINVSHTAAREEKCEESGLAEYWKCEDCGTYFSAFVSNDENTVIKNFNSWSEAGGDGYLAATGHSYNAVVTAPTCTEKGFTIHTCECGDSYVDMYVKAIGHSGVITAEKAATCNETGTKAYWICSGCGEVFQNENCTIKVENFDSWVMIPASGHSEVTDEAVEASCKKVGWTEGKHCSACGEVLIAPTEIPKLEHEWDSGRKTLDPTCEKVGERTFTCTLCGDTKTEDIEVLGHDLVQHEAKLPTYASVGYDAYEDCSRCDYTTYEEIPVLEMADITDYGTFMENLQLLEGLANDYARANPGKDPAMLVIKYIRTGVDRYNSGSWNIMAGYEDPDFAKFVAKAEESHNLAAASTDEMIAVTSIKNIEKFTLPNGDLTDIGHMFGTMDISYTKAENADVGGWAGDICDLLSQVDRYGLTGTLEELVKEISENYLCVHYDESDTFGPSDMYGDLDGFYAMQKFTSQEYESGLIYNILDAYFTEELSDEDRADFFLKNRLNGVSSRAAVRDAVYGEYTSNKSVATLEATREFSSEQLSDLRRACCYAFADYLCKLAGDYVDAGENTYYSVISTETSILAPGITQEINKAYTADNKQIVFYVATADISSEYVDVYANYKDNDPSAGWAMARVSDQMAAAQEKYGNPESEHYIPNYNVIAGINASGYNMSNGQPTGLFIMNGVEYSPINSNGFFGILKDGTAVIATMDEYNSLYRGQVQESVGGFGTTLIRDGKVLITATGDYYTDRASRTAVGITKTGKVVFVVLDGRQEPVSCGGSMQELAQIMLEAGCVDAINLDGGGSATYVSKAEGSDTIAVTSNPSDGFERSVSNSLMMVSTAPSSTAFDHAILSADTNYLTIGSSVQVSAKGVSPMGNAAEIPEGTTWSLSNDSIGKIDENGMFTAYASGNVDVHLLLEGEVVGSLTLYVVIPDALYFSKTTIDAVYGERLQLPLVALYEGKTVTINEDDVRFSLNNEAAGIFDGFIFIGDESSGVKNVSVVAKLVANEEIMASTVVVLYKQGEASFDFDQATGGDRQFAWDRKVSNSTTEDNANYVAKVVGEDMVTSYIFAIDMTQIPIPEQLEDLTYMLPGDDVEGANTAWSFLLQLAERVSPMTEVTPSFTFNENFVVDYSGLTILNEYFELQDDGVIFDEASNTLTLRLNWIDQTKAIDPTTANPLCIVSGLKLSPRDDAAWDDKDRLAVVNYGDISYTIYLRANALYTFAQNEENQKVYNLYPFVNPNDESEKGGYYASTYKEFSDNYTLIDSLKNGWYYENGGYAYYVDGESLKGVQKADGYYYDFGSEGINIGQTRFTGVFSDEGGLRCVRLGVLVTSGWNTFDDVAYHCHEDGYAHVASVKDPTTCVKGGRLTYTCTNCGTKETVGDYVMPNGHDWDENHVCWVCGTVGKNIADAEVNFGKIDNPRTSTTIPKYYYLNGGVRPGTYVTFDGVYALTKSNDNTLNSDGTMRDLYVSWSNNKGIGKAYVEFTGRGDYYGTARLEYHIVPNDVTNLKVSNVTDDSVTLTWDAAAGADYYRLYFYHENGSRDSITKTEGTSYTVTGLTKGESYSFQAAASAYSTDGENKIYNCAKWSNTVTVTMGEELPDTGGTTPPAGDDSGQTPAPGPGTPTPGPSGPSDPVEPEVPDEPETPNVPCPGDETCPADPFEDVDTDKWYHEAVDYVVEENLFRGVAAESFSPGGQMNRAMFWTVLARMDGKEINGTGANWYEEALNWAVQNGISDGTMATQSITREQIVTMLWRYFGSPKSELSLEKFSDADDISAWALEAMKWAVENGVVECYEDGSLRAKNTATRAEVAQLVMNYLEK